LQTTVFFKKFFLKKTGIKISLMPEIKGVFKPFYFFLLPQQPFFAGAFAGFSVLVLVVFFAVAIVYKVNFDVKIPSKNRCLKNVAQRNKHIY